MSRQKLTRLLLGGALGVAALACSAPVPASAAPACQPTQAAGTTCQYTYTNPSGTRVYRVHVPAGYISSGASRPLLMELHGCNSDNAVAEERWSRFSELSDRYGFMVAYPQQDLNANNSDCWNWFLPQNETRNPGQPAVPDTGEPSMIAGITRTVMSKWNVDARRVYVGGISAGGGMSAVMAATYPDIFAAAMVYAGCEYMGETCTSGPAALPPQVSGQLAYQAGGQYARTVPVITIHGTADEVVPYANSALVVQSFLHMDSYAVNGGTDTAPVLTLPDKSTTATSPGGQLYLVQDYHDPAGCLLAQQWSVNGMLHAWSAGGSNGSATDMVFTDPAGPDVSTPIYQFFMSHPMPPAGNHGCYQPAAAGPASAATAAASSHGRTGPTAATGSGLPLTGSSRPLPAGPILTIVIMAGVILAAASAARTSRRFN